MNLNNKMKRLIFTIIALLSIVVCNAQLNGNFKSVRFRPPQDTTTFAPKFVGTVTMGLDSVLYVVNQAGFWEALGSGSGGAYTASNGITLDGSNFNLGGTLTENTTINGNGGTYNFRIYDFNQLLLESNYVNAKYGLNLNNSADYLYLRANTPTDSQMNQLLLGTSFGVFKGVELQATGNFTVRTDTIGAAVLGGNERLKIDSVGNVSFSNTKNFTVNNIGAFNGGAMQISKDTTSQNSIVFYSRTNGDIYSGISMYDPSLEFVSLGGNINLLTGLAGGVTTERLKIDSVGNIDMLNTNELEITSGDNSIYMDNDFVQLYAGANNSLDIGNLFNTWRIDGSFGTAGQVISSDGSGSFVWDDIPAFGVTTADGGAIQYNLGGSLTGGNDLYYNETLNYISLPNTAGTTASFLYGGSLRTFNGSVNYINYDISGVTGQGLPVSITTNGSNALSLGTNTGDLYLNGNAKIYRKDGANLAMGTGTLVGGTVTIANTLITANTRIFTFIQTVGGVVGVHYVSARVANTSFTITSSSGADTSTFAYVLYEPN